MNAVARVFVDTNVLVYGHDSAAPLKQKRAQTVLSTLVDRSGGALSTQVLGELYAVASRRFRHRLSRETAAEQVRNFAASWNVLPVLPETVLLAVRGAERYGFSYDDAQIWAVAKLGGIPYVLSEDFEDGREIEGVRFADPFVPGFDIEALLA